MGGLLASNREKYGSLEIPITEVVIRVDTIRHDLVK